MYPPRVNMPLPVGIRNGVTFYWWHYQRWWISLLYFKFLTFKKQERDIVNKERPCFNA